MKKLLFIMILATTFLPISQTGAEMNVQDKQKANEVKAEKKQTSKGIDALNSEKPLQSIKLKKEVNINKKSQNRARLTNKKIANQRKDRLFALLLLAHGSQR